MENRKDRQEKILKDCIKSIPESQEPYMELTHLYRQKGQWEKAIATLEAAVEKHPESAVLANNLAWLYTGSEDPSLSNPHRALLLARMAAELNHSAYIFDTLAESYFVNGMIPEAIEAGEQALKRAKDNRSYYKKQIEKFRKAGKP